MNTSNAPIHDECDEKLIDLTELKNDDDEEEEIIDLMPPLPALGPNIDASQILNETESETETGPIVFFSEDHPANHYNELQRFVAHEDFDLFIPLASKVKIIRNDLYCGHVPDTSDVLTISHMLSRKGEDEADDLAQNIQMKLLLGPNSTVDDLDDIILPNGVFERIDVMMEKSIDALCVEFNRCMTWYCAMTNQYFPKSPPRKKYRVESNVTKPPGEAVVVKYSKWQTDILTNWMIDHRVSIAISFFNSLFFTSSQLSLTINVFLPLPSSIESPIPK